MLSLPLSTPSHLLHPRFPPLPYSYYSEKEGRQSAESGLFNIHPRGVLPLGGCWAEEHETSDKPHVFCIRHPDFGDATVFLACESAKEREDWLRAVRESGRVTYRNAQIGETMIQCLKAKTEVREKQTHDTRVRLDVSRETRRKKKVVRVRVRMR